VIVTTWIGLKPATWYKTFLLFLWAFLFQLKIDAELGHHLKTTLVRDVHQETL
jgi:hypothetical protein